MKLVSWNVNGIRACIKKGFFDFLENSSIDIICLQETKAQREDLEMIFQELGDFHSFFSCAEKKGYSGVGVISRKSLGSPSLVKLAPEVEVFNNEGRTLILEYGKFFLVSAYFPNGQRDHARVDFKLQYCLALEKFCSSLAKKKGKPLIICGDFNTAHHPIDLQNPKGNVNTTGFLPRERVYLDELIKKGYIDIFREHHPGETGHYTWWTYRNNCRERNIGWRIDYFFITKNLIPFVKKTRLYPEILGSDHCPIGMELSFE